MKKATALKIYPTASQLAVALGITQQAVSKWPDDVPRRHVERLRELRSMSKAKRAAVLNAAAPSKSVGFGWNKAIQKLYQGNEAEAAQAVQS